MAVPVLRSLSRRLMRPATAWRCRPWLSGAGTPPESLEVSASVTFAEVDGGWKVSSSALTVVGRVPGIDKAGFQNAAERAKDGCAISGALKGNVDLSVEASLA